MSEYTKGLTAEQLIEYIAKDYVELSHEKIVIQRNDFMSICREWLQEKLQEKLQTRPQNCGTSFCSCIECVMEPEQQPVAWLHRQGNFTEACMNPLHDDEIDRGWTQEPLYTTPPTQCLHCLQRSKDEL